VRPRNPLDQREPESERGVSLALARRPKEGLERALQYAIGESLAAIPNLEHY